MGDWLKFWMSAIIRKPKELSVPKSNLVEQCKPLLDLIKRYESRGNYNIVWGGIKRPDHPPKPLVKMTVGEVLAWQASIDHKYRSEASGAYQIMEDTLRDYYKSAGVSLSDLFDEATQDRLAVRLLRRRGLGRFLSSKCSAADVNRFANNLAKEWASFPVVSYIKDKRIGSSYYAGDGLNKAHCSVADVKAAVKAIHGANK